MAKVRVGIIGVGNCASSLVQGVQYYKDANDDDFVPGLMHVNLGGYHIRDIEFSCAFDVDADKVGKDLSQAIFSGQNNTIKFSEVPYAGVKVERELAIHPEGGRMEQRSRRSCGARQMRVAARLTLATSSVAGGLSVGAPPCLWSAWGGIRSGGQRRGIPRNTIGSPPVCLDRQSG